MTDDRIYERLDETCKIIHEMKTDVALIQKDIKYIKKAQEDKRQDKIQKRDYLTGLVSFVFFGYIALKENLFG